jgi:hypothetical protein
MLPDSSKSQSSALLSVSMRLTWLTAGPDVGRADVSVDDVAKRRTMLRSSGGWLEEIPVEGRVPMTAIHGGAQGLAACALGAD